MDFLERMNKVMDYVESHIIDELSYEEIAKISCCPAHQFNRIFSYVIGINLSEYIRCRRLTLAAFELQTNDVKIIDVAYKYGYSSPNSFTRAFIEMHNITPKEARSKGAVLKSYSRLSFHIFIKGGVYMNYRIEEKGEFTGVGLSREFSVPDGDDGAIWREFFDKGINEKIRDELKLYRPPFWQMGVYVKKGGGKYELFIGAEFDGSNTDGLDTIVIPAKTWAVFTVAGTGGFGEIWTRINMEWLPTSQYILADDAIQEIEVFPMDRHADDPGYSPEIWIPVTRK